MKMFKIFIKNLKLYGYHGVNPEEKREGQYFVFNVEINIFKDSFQGNDDLSETVNYSEAVKIIKRVNSAIKYDLVETLAEEITLRISRLSSLISSVKTRVEKINPPINEKLDSVGVEFKLKVKNKYPSDQKEDTGPYNPKLSISGNKELPFKSKKNTGRGYRLVYLSIGTNKGNKMDNIKKVLYMIFKSDIFSVFEVSSVYETEPMYEKNQDNFYNIVIKAAVKSSLSPFVVLGYVKSIEYEMGRETQAIKNGPRLIDIDILSIDDIKINSDILKLPHPGLSERNFVLIPLSDISPDFEINGININEFVKKHKFKEKVTRINGDMMIF
jgi:dihydroneopterin aldolase / 2-amino-4-hydroxy-6-hydroxymethyldihydropteridine diphosphokinase